MMFVVDLGFLYPDLRWNRWFFFYPLVFLRERNTSIGGVWTASHGVESQSRQLGSAT